MNETSPLKRAADGLVEASCLIAVLALPLYFSVLTSSGYEPDKAVLLRVFAIVAGGAWLVGFLLEPGKPGKSRVSPVLWLGLTVFLAYAVATVFSIDPRLSLWGSHVRQQGLWTRASYLIFLVAAMTRLRTPAQHERLVSILLFGS